MMLWSFSSSSSSSSSSLSRIPSVCLQLLLLWSAPWSSSAWEATWESLDSRPLPPWYDDAKFGIFIHWGVFSVPSFGTEWFWQRWQEEKYHEFIEFVQQTENVRFSYADYAARFDATLYRPQEWADIFGRSGAQYIVLTSKHHEGFCNWDSRSIPTTWNWNALDVGPKRDLLGDLAAAVKNQTSVTTNQTLRWGVYHSLFEWFNPLWKHDVATNFTTQDFVTTKTMPELYDLVDKYQPELIWSDGDWNSHSDYWKATEFLAWYATNSSVASTAVWNDRWGHDALCKHGSYITCNDKYQPGKLVTKKWENCYTVDQTSWGWNRNASYADYYSTASLLHTLIETVAYNGNMLLNVGPAADGTISPIFVDRLLHMGEWLQVNGAAIYQSRPWQVCQLETSGTDDDVNPSGGGVPVYYTTNSHSKTLYAIFTAWPAQSELILSCPQPTAQTQIQLLGYSNDNNSNNDNDNNKMKKEIFLDYATTFNFTTTSTDPTGHLVVQLPWLTPDVIPCQHAWVLAMTGIGNFVEWNDNKINGDDLKKEMNNDKGNNNNNNQRFRTPTTTTTKSTATETATTTTTSVA